MSLRNQGRSYDSRWFHHSGSGSTTGSPTSRPRSGSRSWRSSTGSSSCGARRPRGTGAAQWRGRRRAAAADDADHRRSWFVYVVKLARGIDRERGDRRASPRRASRPATTSRRSTFSRTCASASASPRACARSRKHALRARWRSRSSRRSKPPTKSGSWKPLRGAHLKVSRALHMSRRRAICGRSRFARHMSVESLVAEMSAQFLGGVPLTRRRRDNPLMADADRMIFLGFGKYARADKIYALEPLAARRARGRPPHARLDRRRPRPDHRRRAPSARSSTTWARTPRSSAPIIDEALEARRTHRRGRRQRPRRPADLGRRARRLLEKTSSPGDEENSSSLSDPFGPPVDDLAGETERPGRLACLRGLRST